MKHPRLFLKRKIHIRKTQGLSGKSSLSGDLSVLYLCKHAVPIWPVTFLPRSCKINWLVSPGLVMGWWQCVLAAGGAAGGFIVRRWRAAPSELYLPGTTTRHYTGQQPLPGLQGSLMTSTQTWLSSCHHDIMTWWLVTLMCVTLLIVWLSTELLYFESFWTIEVNC